MTQAERTAQHTAGPWQLRPPPFGGDHDNPWAVYAADNHAVAIISALRQPAQANARLIAAAPEMYEALKQLIEMLDYYRSAGFVGESAAINPHRAKGYAAAKAAIAKAEGRDS